MAAVNTKFGIGTKYFSQWEKLAFVLIYYILILEELMRYHIFGSCFHQRESRCCVHIMGVEVHNIINQPWIS